MDSMQSSEALRAIVLSFPLNPRKITDKLLSDVEKINHVDSCSAFGSNMRFVRNSSTSVKLYLPNFSDGGFSTTFSVSGDMPEERLARLINVYGLAASLRQFDFIHYVASSHFIVCISISNTISNANYAESVRALNDLHNFLQVHKPTKFGK